MMSNHALIAIAVFTLAGETKRLHVSDYHLVCSIKWKSNYWYYYDGQIALSVLISKALTKYGHASVTYEWDLMLVPSTQILKQSC